MCMPGCLEQNLRMSPVEGPYKRTHTHTHVLVRGFNWEYERLLEVTGHIPCFYNLTNLNENCEFSLVSEKWGIMFNRDAHTIGVVCKNSDFPHLNGASHRPHVALNMQSVQVHYLHLGSSEGAFSILTTLNKNKQSYARFEMYAQLPGVKPTDVPDWHLLHTHTHTHIQTKTNVCFGNSSKDIVAKTVFFFYS